jgi:hypothetical protein
LASSSFRVPPMRCDLRWDNRPTEGLAIRWS